MKIISTSTSFTGTDTGAFLAQLPDAEGDDPGIPIYLDVGSETFAFVDWKKMATGANKQFQEKAPPGILRGGAIIKVTSRFGTLVVPDERSNWLKPFAGIAHHSEGLNLNLTGERELDEEAFVYDIKKKKRFVPVGSRSVGRVCRLGFEVSEIVETGRITEIGYRVNETNKALEAVLAWDITAIDEKFSVSLEEEWWAGGQNGVSVYAINGRGQLVGVFSGQQGFVELPKLGIHPTLSQFLGT